MSPKVKAFVYNLCCFAVIFLAFRFTLGYVLPLSGFWMSIVCAVLASILAPKFAVVKLEGKEKVLMKTIFKKGHTEV